MNKEFPKPPMGITPRFIVEEKRLEEVTAGIKRYLAAGLPVAPEWIEEYNYLTKQLKNGN